MTNREAVLNAIKAQGKRDAQSLQQKINSLTDTQIIQQEMKIPFFDSNKDYSEWEIGSVVKDEKGNDKILVSANEKSRYSQLISNEFFKEIK